MPLLGQLEGSARGSCLKAQADGGSTLTCASTTWREAENKSQWTTSWLLRVCVEVRCHFFELFIGQSKSCGPQCNGVRWINLLQKSHLILVDSNTIHHTTQKYFVYCTESSNIKAWISKENVTSFVYSDLVSFMTSQQWKRRTNILVHIDE